MKFIQCRNDLDLLETDGYGPLSHFSELSLTGFLGGVGLPKRRLNLELASARVLRTVGVCFPQGPNSHILLSKKVWRENFFYELEKVADVSMALEPTAQSEAWILATPKFSQANVDEWAVLEESTFVVVKSSTLGRNSDPKIVEANLKFVCVQDLNAFTSAKSTLRPALPVKIAFRGAKPPVIFQFSGRYYFQEQALSVLEKMRVYGLERTGTECMMTHAELSPH